MKRKMNPVAQEDYKLGKILLRIFVTLFVLPFTGSIFLLLYDIYALLVGKPQEVGTPLGLAVVLIFLYSWMTRTYIQFMTPKNRDSAIAVNDVFTHKRLKQLLEGVEFRPTEIRHVYESELWLKVDGSFIPKNFVLGFTVTARHPYIVPIYKLGLMLVTGNMGEYSVGDRQGLIDPTLDKFKEMLPHADISGSMTRWTYDDKVIRTLHQRKLDYIASGESLEPMIEAWTDYQQTALEEYERWKEADVANRKALEK